MIPTAGFLYIAVSTELFLYLSVETALYPLRRAGLWSWVRVVTRALSGRRGSGPSQERAAAAGEARRKRGRGRRPGRLPAGSRPGRRGELYLINGLPNLGSAFRFGSVRVRRKATMASR